jgi:GNAT superfamily N-acetyltransferase
VGLLTEVAIRPARPEEDDRLREIAAAAKGHWGYDAALVSGWAAGLELPRDGERWVAEAGAAVVAWAELEAPVDGVAVLDDLWVEPAWFGRGIGRRLFEVAAARARELGARTMEWGAEPNALGFYEKLGGRYLRDHVTEWGRAGRVMGIDL